MSVKSAGTALGLRRLQALGRVVRRPFNAVCRFLGAETPISAEHSTCYRSQQKENFKGWGFFEEEGHPRVLIASGFGYGNVGDEAQLGAAVGRWRRVAPGAPICVLSPNPGYTKALHQVEVDWAPRVVWFGANRQADYGQSSARFRRRFFLTTFRLLFSARCARAGIPLSLTRPEEAALLRQLHRAEILHISGGGFLTGMTQSRLWDHCLLMRLAHLLGCKILLTGHNIGVFKGYLDRRIARWGLRHASYIGLRDRGLSEEELRNIGIHGDHVASVCDDALICEKISEPEVKALLEELGLDPEAPFAVVNFHEWGQSSTDKDRIVARYADHCDFLVKEFGLQVIAVSMAPSDEPSNRKLLEGMQESGTLLPYSPDYRVVRGLIASARMVFTMKHHPIVFAQGECVPVVSVALDDYYRHKNNGALANTGHEEYSVTWDDFFDEKGKDTLRKAFEESQISPDR